ncbi:cbb3-type cytochrome c oxidase subunit 3 [Hyphomicrobium sp.]|uniref:cbb3-type cytochrome c oxidase subunit 3 n=1 Tax=Hyphomicrobium sp. TaxID=82 RepID=UPI002E2FE762|nr:cbb3-type cytochrome c oxidase subunit 3 [Hyphomicrobium sp.]HEX2842525.1 cbb3-type cytochrome c oxidase subunit 3 [Hyphomicrobium sp.]
MTYETVAATCQIVAMGLFGIVMLGVLIHVFRPGNKAHFEAASRLPLDDTREYSNGK